MTQREYIAPSGQRFISVGTQPYIRLDGRATTLLRWRSTCRLCGCFFEVMTPVVHWRRSGAFSVVHCTEHRLRPGAPRGATRHWTPDLIVRTI